MKQQKIDLRYFNSLIVPLPPNFNLIPYIYLYNQFNSNETMCCGFDFINENGELIKQETFEQYFHFAGNKIAPKNIPNGTSYFLAWAYPKNEQLQNYLIELKNEKIFNHVYAHSNSLNYSFKNGVMGGINYQFFPTNGLSDKGSSLIMQSPKVYIDFENSTVVSFTYYTLNAHELESAHLTVSLRNQNGDEVYQRQVEIKPNCIHYEIFNYETKLSGWFTLFAICTNRAIIPISFLINPNKSITVDHSMPPVAYSMLWSGNRRSNSIHYLEKQFQGHRL
ncbi:MAG: hypothetical protein U0T83_11070 [Bacteriovoracaceae bacterium]